MNLSEFFKEEELRELCAFCNWESNCKECYDELLSMYPDIKDKLKSHKDCRMWRRYLPFYKRCLYEIIYLFKKLFGK